MRLFDFVSTPRLRTAYRFLERAERLDRFGLLVGLRVAVAFEFIRRRLEDAWR